MSVCPASVRVAAFVGALILSSSPAPVNAAEKALFTPHRAVYDMNLADSAQSKRIDSLTGRLVYETTGNNCDGYSHLARQIISLETEAGSMTLDSVSSSYESVDGKHIRFKRENRVNGKAMEDTDGEGIIADDGEFQVRMKLPVLKRLSLKGEVILPGTHIQKILEAARAGRSTLSARVYDGRNAGETVYETLAIIGARIPPGAGSGLEEAALNPVLVNLPRWPVKITYFRAGDTEATPDHSISSELYENGISRAVRLDFSDHSVRADLKAVEFLPKGDCQR